MSEIKIAEITAKTTAKGKPYWLAKDGNGTNHSVWEPSVHAFLEQHLGQPVSVVIRQDGKYSTIEKAELPVVEPPKPQSNGWKRDPEEGKLIVRQSCLKAAVDFCGPPIEPMTSGLVDVVLSVADQFVAWVYGQEAVGAAAPVRTASPSPRRFTTGLREGETLAEAAKRAVEEHDALDLTNIPPADAIEDGPSNRTPYPRERMAPAGARKR